MRWPCSAAVTLLFLVTVSAQRGSRRFSASSTDNTLPTEESTSSRSHRFHGRESSRDVSRTQAVPRQDFPHRDAEVIPSLASTRGSPRASFRSRNEVSSKELHSRNEVPIVSSGAVEYERLQNVAKPSRRTFTSRGQSSSDSSASRSHLNEVEDKGRPVPAAPGRSNRFSSRGSGVETSPSPRRLSSTVQSYADHETTRSNHRSSPGRTSSRSSSQTESPVRNEPSRPVPVRSRESARTRTPDESSHAPEVRSQETTVAPQRHRLPDSSPQPERPSFARNKAGGRSLNLDKGDASSEVPTTRGRGRTSSRTTDVSGRSSFRSRESSRDEASQEGSRGSTRTSGRLNTRNGGEDALTTRGRSSERFKSRAPKTEDRPVPTEPPVTVPTRELFTSTAVPEKEALVEAEVPKEEIAETFASPEPATHAPAREIRTTSNPLARGAPRSNRGRGTARASSADLKSGGLKEKETDEVRDDDNYPAVYKQLKKSGTDPKDILALLKAKKAARETQQNPKQPQLTPLAPDDSPVSTINPKDTADLNPSVAPQGVSHGPRNFRKNLGRRISTGDEQAEVPRRSAEPQEISSGSKNGVKTGGPFRASPVFRPRSHVLEKDLNDDAEPTKEIDSGAERSRFVPTRARLPGRGYSRSTANSVDASESTTEESKEALLSTRRYENIAKYRGRSSDKPEKPEYEPGIVKRRNFPRLNNVQITTEAPREEASTGRTKFQPKRGYKRLNREEVVTETPKDYDSPVAERNSRYPSRSFPVDKSTVEAVMREPVKEENSKYSSVGRQRSFRPGLNRPSLKPGFRPSSRAEARGEEDIPEEENSANELIREETEDKNLQVALIHEGNERRGLSKSRYDLEEKLGLKSNVPPQQRQGGTEQTSYRARDRAGDMEKFRARTEGNNDEPTNVTPIKPRYHLYDRQNDGTKKQIVPAPIETTTSQEKYKGKYKSYQSNKERSSFTLPRKVFTRTTPIPPSLSRYKDRKESLSRQFVPKVHQLNTASGLDEEVEDDSEFDDPLRRGFNGLSIDSLVSESEFSTITTEPHNSVFRANHNRRSDGSDSTTDNNYNRAYYHNNHYNYNRAYYHNNHYNYHKEANYEKTVTQNN
ncbi:hypothetical protein GE061_006226 [Apolygus lucorum]|uniref:Uncharacterized protein n=1 Tax=Apolygus lucorum TaxID=248454 RepID=A0A8S9WV15_APOLU|nr:hypothetical protein GE061_006226 [Apolygus lucorum]